MKNIFSINSSSSWWWLRRNWRRWWSRRNPQKQEIHPNIHSNVLGNECPWLDASRRQSCRLTHCEGIHRLEIGSARRWYHCVQETPRFSLRKVTALIVTKLVLHLIANLFPFFVVVQIDFIAWIRSSKRSWIDDAI